MSRLLRGVVALLGAGLIYSPAVAETRHPKTLVLQGINDAYSDPSDPQVTPQEEALTPPFSKVGFSLLYPTLSPNEPILLPEDLAARDEARPAVCYTARMLLMCPDACALTLPVCPFSGVCTPAAAKTWPSEHLFKAPPACYVNVYIQPTNWFVDPDKASLQSLATALKTHALRLLRMREKAARLHRNLLIRKPTSWLSRMKARLTAELGAVCFMQPAASQQRRGTETVRLLRVHKQAKLNSLFDSNQKDQVFTASGGTIPLDAQIIGLEEAVANEEEYRKASEQAPQNVFGLCRKPRSTMLRRLADKGFVLCTVVLKNGQHFVDRCKDLPVDDIHTMQAVDKLHRSLNDPSLPMLGYVPMSLPPETAEVRQTAKSSSLEFKSKPALEPFHRFPVALHIRAAGNFPGIVETKTLSAVLRDLSRAVPPITFEEASVEACVAHISRELQEIEDLHVWELWRTAEMGKAITSEMVLRSMVKFAHFTVREIAPNTSPEYRLSLLKLTNKWSRTTELLRKFNEAVASCSDPTVRQIYFPQYESKKLPLPNESINDLPFQISRILSVEIPPVHRLLLGGAYLLSLTLNRRGLVEGIGRKEISDLVQRISNLLIAFASKYLQPKALNYVRKYVQEVALVAGRILDIALDPEIQWELVRILMVVPFWLFAFGRYCGPADKNAAFELGYGLCPFHLLNFFVKDATAASMEQPGLQNWAKQSISKLVRRIEAETLPDKAKEHANVFLEQHMQNLPHLRPDLFRRQDGKVFKASVF